MKLYIQMIFVSSVLGFLLLCAIDIIEGVEIYHNVNVDWKVNGIISVGSAFVGSTIVNFIEVWFWFGKKIGTV